MAKKVAPARKPTRTAKKNRGVNKKRRTNRDLLSIEAELRADVLTLQTNAASMRSVIEVKTNICDTLAKRVLALEETIKVQHSASYEVLKLLSESRWRAPEGLPPGIYLVRESNCYSRCNTGNWVMVFQPFVWDLIFKPTKWGLWEICNDNTTRLLRACDRLGRPIHDLANRAVSEYTNSENIELPNVGGAG